jgi:ATP-dependent Lhr-like helicase
MRSVLAADALPSHLHESARETLVKMREDFCGLVSTDERSVVEIDDEEVRWWTFAGGRINTTLKYAIEANSSCKAVPDNLVVKIRGEGARGDELRALLQRLREPGLWDDANLWLRISASLPNYRLSKFQDVLPPEAQAEMIGEFLLDIQGARRAAYAMGPTLRVASS